MKVYFIWGFLGSGKTTLINYLLNHVFFDKNVVIIENESDELSIDGFYLVQKQYIVKKLNSGCILRIELPKILQAINKEYSPDIVLVEVSGLASLEAIYKIPDLLIDGVLSLLDVTKYKLLMRLNERFYTHQYSISPVILLTKTDVKGDNIISLNEVVKQYDSEVMVIENYQTLSKGMWYQLLQKAIPSHYTGSYFCDWNFCTNKTYIIDRYIDTKWCIFLVQYILRKNKNSIFRAKGLMNDANGIMCKFDIHETSYTCVTLDEVDKNKNISPFISIWWNKNINPELIEWFSSFFQVYEKTCELSYKQVDDREIWNYMGGEGFSPSLEILSIVKKLEAEALSICKPRFGFRIFPGKIVDDGHLIIAKNSFNPKGIIKKYLKNCDAYTLLVASVGSEMNEWIINKYGSGDVMEAFIADILGSVFVESVAAYAIKLLERIADSAHWKITNSYSPGYCGWNVKEQQILFSMLPKQICGVELSESSLMIPIKSISAVIGLGEKAEKKPYGCKICKKKDCYKRKSLNS